MREEDYADFFNREDVKRIIAFQESKAVKLPSVSLLWIKQRGKCYWCDARCLQPTKENRRKYGNGTLPVNFFTLDHVHSRWQGGLNKPENVVGACNRCNNFRNSTEQKRQVGRKVANNQPEEIRLKRFVKTNATTVPFEEGRTRREQIAKRRSLFT